MKNPVDSFRQVISDELTVSPDRPEETPETTVTTLTEVTNEKFLTAVFTQMQPNERPMIVSIAGSVNAQTKWPPGIGWTANADTHNTDRNWYFTLSTYLPKDGGYRRKKEQFHRACGVYLDDIGTKAAPRERLDACPPSYLIETSLGNYQAGYLFVQPVKDLAQVDALQEALVKAGLCDPGAKGPSARLGRLPYGVNGKYSPPQRCRLVEWHPDRRYSIEQIVELLELEPVQPVGLRRKTRSAAGRQVQLSDGSGEDDIYRPRAAENVVLTALRQRGLYKQPLGDLKHEITCPWVHEHTGGIDNGSAYFEPTDLFPVGGFKCQHSHGDTKRISALLAELGVSFTEAKHKPTIRVTPGELHRVVDAAEQELAVSRRHYQRGGLIVNVVTDPGTQETIIKPVNANGLMRALSAGATWERFDARTKDYVVIDPPTRHVAVLYDSESYRHLPVLNGIARQPYLRQDGSLMTAAGFDPASGMFGVFDERAFHVPDKPTLEDAMRALKELNALLTEFGFAQPHDRAATLGMMLTAAIRSALPVAPMAHIKAPQIASGKSYLCGLIAAFAGPTRPAAYAFPGNEEECAKLLLSTLLESPAVVMFDNLTGDLLPFKSLCSALTEEFMTGRVLGVSKTATVGTRTLFLSSGNNVDPVRDMARRAVTITLDPKCETPPGPAPGDPLSPSSAWRQAKFQHNL